MYSIYVYIHKYICNKYICEHVHVYFQHIQTLYIAYICDDTYILVYKNNNTRQRGYQFDSRRAWEVFKTVARSDWKGGQEEEKIK